MLFIKAKSLKKKWIISYLKENNIKYTTALNYILIFDKELFLFIIPNEILLFNDNNNFFNHNDIELIKLKKELYSKNYNLLKLKKIFEKNSIFKFDFQKQYEYYRFSIKDKKYNTELYSFFEYGSHIMEIQNKIEEFNKLKLKMNKEIIPKVKENIKNQILNGYNINLEEYHFELENESDEIYTAIFENKNSGKLIVVKKIKINLKNGEIIFAGEKNNALYI